PAPAGCGPPRPSPGATRRAGRPAPGSHRCRRSAIPTRQVSHRPPDAVDVLSHEKPLLATDAPPAPLELRQALRTIDRHIDDTLTWPESAQLEAFFTQDWRSSTQSGARPVGTQGQLPCGTGPPGHGGGSGGAGSLLAPGSVEAPSYVEPHW